MTENERRVLDYIKKCESEGFLPSVRDVCGEMGFTSSATGYGYINKLTEKGLLVRTGTDGRQFRTAGQRPVSVPVAVNFPHGVPEFDEYSEQIYFLPDRLNIGKLFAYRITENMTRIRAAQGDIFIFEMQDYAMDGDIIIALDADGKEFVTVFSPSENEGVSRFRYPDSENKTIMGKSIGMIRYIR